MPYAADAFFITYSISSIVCQGTILRVKLYEDRTMLIEGHGTKKNYLKRKTENRKRYMNQKKCRRREKSRREEEMSL